MTAQRISLADVVAALRAFLAAEYPQSEPQRLAILFRFQGREEQLDVSAGAAAGRRRDPAGLRATRGDSSRPGRGGLR